MILGRINRIELVVYCKQKRIAIALGDLLDVPLVNVTIFRPN